MKRKMSIMDLSDDWDNRPSQADENDIMVMHRRKCSCPSFTEFIEFSDNLMTRERSVESDDGENDAANILDKLNGINESLHDKQKSKRGFNERRGYDAPGNLLVGSASRFFKDFRRDDSYKAHIRKLVEKRVFSKTRQHAVGVTSLTMELVIGLKNKTCMATKKLAAPSKKHKVPVVEQRLPWDSEMLMKKISKPKFCRAKSTTQRIQDLTSG